MPIRKKMRRYCVLILTFVVSIAFLLLIAFGFIGFNKSLQQQQLTQVRQSVQAAIIHCYSLEGSYPPNLEYLSKNYGLIIDNKHYIYDYSIFASNIPPEVHIYKRN